MNDDLRKLFEFLEGRTSEVMGRSAPPVAPAMRDLLARFAAGDSTEEERVQVKQLLDKKPDMVPLLVAETISLRQLKK